MPFILTLPQRIEGTDLGFSVYPYDFSFYDHVERKRNFDQMLVIGKLKDTGFLEYEEIMFERKFSNAEVPRNFIDETLAEFVSKNPSHVFNMAKLETFFYRPSQKAKLEKQL